VEEDIKMRISSFVTHFYERWQKADRKAGQFISSKQFWLANEFRMPDLPTGKKLKP